MDETLAEILARITEVLEKTNERIAAIEDTPPPPTPAATQERKDVR